MPQENNKVNETVEAAELENLSFELSKMKERIAVLDEKVEREAKKHNYRDALLFQQERIKLMGPCDHLEFKIKMTLKEQSDV